MRGYEDLFVWRRGMDLAEEVYRLCRVGDLKRDWGLRNQLTRSAVSVPSNIAEGYERGGRKEFARALTIAKGSCGEVRTQLVIAQRAGLISGADVAKGVAMSTEVSALLAKLRAVVRRQKDDPERS